MKTTRSLWGVVALFTSLLGGLGQANGTVVFDNGPLNNWAGAYAINNGASVSDSFTISSPTTLESAQLGLYAQPGASPTSLHWSIGSTIGGSDLGSGTANTLYNTYVATTESPYNLPMYESAFNLNVGTLAVGTYYLTLSSAVASDLGQVWWNASGWFDLPDKTLATAYQFGGSGNIPSEIQSESFQLYNTPVPEPSTMIAGALALLLPFGASALRVLRKRQLA